MQKASIIKYIKHDDIDFKKWDEAILNSLNSRVYAMAWYLNYMSGDWDALILGDYEYVMPLPYRKKFGIKYIYVPAFVQQGGVFSAGVVKDDLVTAFLQAIPKKYSYCEITLNSNNRTTTPSILRKNYLLPLHKHYKDLRENYSRSAQRNIKKAIQQRVEVAENISPEITIQLHQQRFKNKVGANEKDYKRLKALLLFLTGKGFAISFAAKKNDTIIASSTYLIHKDRIIFLLNGNTPQSLENGATHLLKDHVIKKFSNTAFTLDFEGSDFPSFARFYEQFGAKEIEFYPHLIINRLPSFLKWLKPSTVSI